MILSLILFGLGIACYSISQLQIHGKLQTKKGYKPFGFWGEESFVRKYKGTTELGMHYQAAPNNWYYHFFKIKYKERFPLSATFLVSLTDAYHLMQSASFVLFSLSLSLATDINFFWIWFSILLIHFTTYRLLRK